MKVTEIYIKSKTYDLKQIDQRITETAANIARAAQTLAEDINRIGEIDYIDSLSAKLHNLRYEREGIMETIKAIENIQNAEEDGVEE